MQATGGTSRRREYPYQVRDLANLPDGLRQLAEQALPLAERAETIFVIPGQMLAKKFGGMGGMHWVPEQALLFTAQGVVHVQAGKSPDEIGHATYLPGASLLYARVSLVILYGRMELCGGSENLTRIVVEYNSVSHELMQPAFLNFLRLAWKPAQFREENNYQNLLKGKLNEQSYKFSSGLEKYCLQADEYLHGFVFQPRVYKHYFRVFHRLTAPASLLALTDRQLILIEEGMTSATSYGYFFTYCPRANVLNVDTKPSDKLDEVHVQLGKDAMRADFKVTQEKNNALACQDLWVTIHV